MAHLRQPLSFPSSVPHNPSPPLLATNPPPQQIPLQAAWASLSPGQQQQLFHHLVEICCELLQRHLRDGGKGNAHDTE